MSKNLQNCANCINSKDDANIKLWCDKKVTSVHFNEVCTMWEWDEISYEERVARDGFEKK